MPRDFIPSKEADLLPFAQNMSTKITATPTAYGLLAADATSLASLLASFSTNLALVADPATRTPVTVTNKDVSKAALIEDIRSLSKRIQATASVTPGQKTGLGLPVHKTTPTVIPPPGTKPVVAVNTNGQRTVSGTLKDETTPEKKAKPFGVEAAALFTYVASGTEAPPADLQDWRSEGFITRGDFQINYRPGDVGKTAYIVARWLNPRGEEGPASIAVSLPVAA